MLLIFLFLLPPSIIHVTTSLAIHENTTSTNFKTVKANYSKPHGEFATPSPSPVRSPEFLTVSKKPLAYYDASSTAKPLAVDNANDIMSKLNLPNIKHFKTSSSSSATNKPRYRRNVNDLLEKFTSYDPNYSVRLDDDERNYAPQFKRNGGQTSSHWETDILSRRNQPVPLSEEFSGMQIWNSVNLSGRRERPFYVDEPPYILVRREADYPELIDTGVQNDLFIPPRGRRSDSTATFAAKRSNLNNIFNPANSDLFMPNRDKKMTYDTAANDEHYKRAKYNDFVLGGDDLFFPNRDKKENFVRSKMAVPTSSINQLLNSDEFFYPNRGKKTRLDNILKPNDLFYPNRGKKLVSSAARRGTYISDLTDLDLFVPNRGRKSLLINKREIALNDKAHGNNKSNVAARVTVTATATTATPTKGKSNNDSNKGDRYKRDLLDNLSKEKDTFYSARGRRNNNNNNSNNNNGERNNNNNMNDNNNNEKFIEENNKNFLDDKFYTSNEILKKSTIKNFKNDYGIVDDSRVKSFFFLKQIPSNYGMAGGDETRRDQQRQWQQQQQQHQQIINNNLQSLSMKQQQQDAIVTQLMKSDNTIGGSSNKIDGNDISRYILPSQYVDATDIVGQIYRK